MPGVQAVLALFEKIMRELWISGTIGGAIGGLVVLIGLVVIGALIVGVRSLFVERPLARRPGRKRPRAE